MFWTEHQRGSEIFPSQNVRDLKRNLLALSIGSGFSSMKRRRYLKLVMVLLVFLVFYYFNDKIKYSGRNFALNMQFFGVKKTEEAVPMNLKEKGNSITCSNVMSQHVLMKWHHMEWSGWRSKSKNRNPFLCSSDISHKSWPVNSVTIPETLPFGTLSAERHFQTVLEHLKSCDLPNQVKNLSCLHCIVVGNGGILRNKTLGKKINSYDVVIRLNSGPVIGYENDVGNKTTFRFCYPESVFNDRSQHDANTTMVFVPFKAVDLRWLKEVLLKKRVSLRGFWKKPPLDLIYKNTQIRILNPSVVQKAAFDLLNLPKVVGWPKPPVYPTTGIIAISMALTMCDKVDIAGFKYDAMNPNSTLHYYGNETMSAMKKMLYHNITTEQMLLNKLKSSNIILDLTGNF